MLSSNIIGECAICLEVHTSDFVVMQCCGQILGDECLKETLSISNFCPLCRAENPRTLQNVSNVLNNLFLELKKKSQAIHKLQADKRELIEYATNESLKCVDRNKKKAEKYAKFKMEASLKNENYALKGEVHKVEVINSTLHELVSKKNEQIVDLENENQTLRRNRLELEIQIKNLNDEIV